MKLESCSVALQLMLCINGIPSTVSDMSLHNSAHAYILIDIRYEIHANRKDKKKMQDTVVLCPSYRCLCWRA